MQYITFCRWSNLLNWDCCFSKYGKESQKISKENCALLKSSKKDNDFFPNGLTEIYNVKFVGFLDEMNSIVSL